MTDTQAALQVHREAKRCGEQPGTVDRGRRANDGPMEISDSIGKRNEKTGGAAEEIKGVVGAEDRNADASRSTCDGYRSVKKDAAVVEGIGQRDRVGVNRCDEISAWCEILRAAYTAREKQT